MHRNRHGEGVLNNDRACDVWNPKESSTPQTRSFI